MVNGKPSVSLAAVRGKRLRVLELVKEIEMRGYPGIYCPSIGDGLALCEAIALITERIGFGTAITPIYFRSVEEMTGMEECIAADNIAGVSSCLSDRWLDDTTIAGPPKRVRDEVEKWYAAGIKTPTLVPSSTKGGQLQAFEELFEVFG